MLMRMTLLLLGLGTVAILQLHVPLLRLSHQVVQLPFPPTLALLLLLLPLLLQRNSCWWR
jgi:hypothetical protein